MADGLCGPSNPLQNLQKHSTVDRTLQQDRLTARQSPSQGFRSPGPNAGILDPEFEAFQAGQPPILHPEASPQVFNNFGRPNVLAGPSQAGPSDWASDFQKLKIATPPIHSLGGRVQQPNVAGWHQEFAQQRQQHGTPQGHQAIAQHPLERLSTLAAMPMHMQQPMYPGSSFANHEAAFAAPQPQQEFHQPEADTFDDAAFEHAFEEAARSEALADQEEEQQLETQQEEETVLVNESAERLVAMDPEPPTERLGADLIHDPRVGGNQSLEDQDDPDALARTAGQLLDSVSDNTSAKFKNSMFLELMRQLRDKEVRVSGDKIVGVDPGFEEEGGFDDQGFEHQDQYERAREKEESGMAQRRFINDVVYYSQNQIQDHIQTQNQRILKTIAEYETNFLALLAANPEIVKNVIGGDRRHNYHNLSKQSFPSAVLRETVALLVKINRLAFPIRNLQTLPSIGSNSDLDIQLSERNRMDNIQIGNALSALAFHPFLAAANGKLRDRIVETAQRFYGLAEEIDQLRRQENNDAERMGEEQERENENSNNEPWGSVVRAWLAGMQTQTQDKSKWSGRRRTKWFISPGVMSQVLGIDEYNAETSRPPTQHHLHQLANTLGSRGQQILLLMSLIWLDDRLPRISYNDFQHLLDGWSDEIPMRVNAVASLEQEPLRDLWYLFAGMRGAHVNVADFDSDLLFPSEEEDATGLLTDEWDGEVGYMVNLARLSALNGHRTAQRDTDMDRVPQGSLSRRKDVDYMREYWAQRVIWEQRHQMGWGWKDERLEENEYRAMLGEMYDEMVWGNMEEKESIGKVEQEQEKQSETGTETIGPEVLEVFKLRDELDHFVAGWTERFHGQMDVQAH